VLHTDSRLDTPNSAFGAHGQDTLGMPLLSPFCANLP
jgi:hypothetical protein